MQLYLDHISFQANGRENPRKSYSIAIYLSHQELPQIAPVCALVVLDVELISQD